MGEVQGLLHVQPSLPSAADKDDRLPNRHDPLRGFGIHRNGRVIRYISSSITNPKTCALTTHLQPDYVDQQDGIQTRSNGQAHVHNDDFVGIASYNIFVGIAVATIFGAGFFFDLFWPERTESKSVRLAWKICSVAVSFMALADAVALTVCCHLSY